MAKSENKRLAVKRNAAKLRTAHEERLAKAEHKLEQGRFDKYGNEIFYNAYGEEVIYDEYGNEILYENTVDSTQAAADDAGVQVPENLELTKPLTYYEDMLYGIIDGLTGPFDPTCASSLYGVVNGGFRAVEYYKIYNPRSTIKFQLAITNFTESTNSVYAFCDFTHLYSQFAMLADTEDWEQYIQIGSRVSGSFLQSVPKYMKCIRQGQSGLNGYDVGICGGGIASLFLDTLL